ncbi:MAG TPA: hypothetical protein VFC09_00215 [Candidatus Dormibacteraeota bacterium]|nr:hypothetical protein [Candidatus Dormibacteraeota bacterium]
MRGWNSRRTCRRTLLLVAAVASGVFPLAVTGINVAAATPTAAPPTPTPTPPPSAVGNEAVIWIAVSPAYEQTGTVVAASASLSGCPSKTNCSHIWVSRDGGYTWKQAAAQGWAGIHPLIAVDGAGHETLFGAANNGVLRSDDYGNTWRAVGPNGGTPTPAPSYAHDQAIAVAGSSDYVLRGSQAQHVSGSGGAMGDSDFAYSPSFPQGGGNPPALLGGSDPKTGLPAVQTCDTNLTCSGTAVLNGAGPMAGPPNLYLSTGFASDGVAFAQTASGIFKTTTGGRTFAPVPVGLSGATATSTAMLALAPHYQESGTRVAYAAVMQVFGSGKSMKRSGGVYRTSDGGTTWKAVGSPSPLDDGALAVAVAPDGRIFGAYLTNQGQGGLLCSTDGQTWRAFCPAVGSHGAVQGARSGGCSAACASAAPGAASPTPDAGSAQGAASATSNGAGPGNGAAALTGSASTGSTGGRSWLLIVAAAILAATAGLTIVRRRIRGRST